MMKTENNVIDFSLHLAKKQRQEVKEWLDKQGVMAIHPLCLPDDDLPSDTEPEEA